MKKTVVYMVFLGIISALLSGCGNKPEVTEVTITSEVKDPETKSEGKSATDLLSDVSELIGMKDEDTAEMFGGGKENWSEDKEFYIGRIYSVETDNETYRVYTTCDDESVVESVSVWIVNGERDVTDEEIGEWKDRVTEFIGAEPTEDPEISEGGSINSCWRADGLAVSMHKMKDILTISIQPEVGELK